MPSLRTMNPYSKSGKHRQVTADSVTDARWNLVVPPLTNTVPMPGYSGQINAGTVSYTNMTTGPQKTPARFCKKCGSPLIVINRAYIYNVYNGTPEEIMFSSACEKIAWICRIKFVGRIISHSPLFGAGFGATVFGHTIDEYSGPFIDV